MAALVLIHGAGDSSRVWEKQAAYFSNHHRVLAVDLPGHGARVREPGRDRHEEYAEEVCRLMDQQGVAKAVVAGHSMGGAVALTMALEHPERLQGLVLVAAGARMKMRPDFLEQARRTAEIYGSEIPSATHIIPVEEMVHPATPGELVLWIKDRTGGASAQATYADFQANNHFDVMNRLGEIRIPTLVIAGSEDRMAPRKFAEFLANGVAGARLEVLDPCGHYPMVEQEQRFNQALESFLAAQVAGVTG